jgi:hypothetical protein
MAKQENSLRVLLESYVTLNPIQQRILQIAALGYYVDTHSYYYGSNLNYQYSNLRKNLLKQLQIDGANLYNGKPIEDKEFTFSII